MNDILIAVLLVAGIGLLAGLGLAVASLIMAVPKDARVEAITAMLPGANCGACGFSGCSGYAAALASGEAKPGLCSPGGNDTAQAVSAFLGGGAVVLERKSALVHCLGSYDNTGDKMEYDGIPTCAAASLLAGGITSCQFGCMGLGDCMRACAYGAIEVCNGVARIDTSRCKGCSMCVAACPKHLITFVPYKAQAVVRCQNCDKGALTGKVCKIGCIACTKCEKVCEFDAVHIKDFHAAVDPEKCTGCGKCVGACPRHCIDLLEVQE